MVYALDVSIHYTFVIPAYNEAEYLPRLLNTLDEARARLGGDRVEIIVANNGSTDATAEIAAERGCSVVNVERRAIAAARNGGARAARGDVLCFVDADIQVHPDTLTAIDRCMQTGHYGGGAAGWRMERSSPGLRCTLAIVRFLTWIGGVNGGVVFCRKDIFEAVGGYNESKKAAEDLEFFRSMRREARKRGLKIKWTTRTPAIVSTRKFDRHGDWHMFYMWLWVFRKRSVSKTIEDYWYSESERF